MPEMIHISKDELSALHVRLNGLAEDLRWARALKTEAAANEECLRLALDAANDGLWDWNMLTDEVDFSPRYYTMLGYAPGEFIASHAGFEQLVYPPDLPAVLQAVDDYLAGKRAAYEMEFRALTRSGEVRWILSRGKVVGRDAQGHPVRIVGTHTDITERKGAEERALRQSAVVDAINRVLRETLSSESDEQVARTCLTVAEELTGSKFGFINELGQAGHMNAIAVSDPGWDACRVPGTSTVLLLQHMEVRGLRGCLMRSGCSMMFDDPASHPDWAGTPEGHPQITCFLGVPLQCAGKTIGMIGLANKASSYTLDDQQAVEALSVAFVGALMHQRDSRALAEERRLLRTLIDTLPDHVYVKDVEGRMVLVNEAQARVAGLSSPKAAVGKTDLELFPSDLATRYMEADQAAMRSGQPVSLEEFYVTPENEGRWLWSIKAPLRDGHGAVVGMVGMSRDITERKRAEEAMHESRARLQSMFDGAAIGIGLFDVHGQGLQVNPAMQQMLGYSVDELTGMTFAQVTHPYDVDESKRCFGQLVSGEIDRFQLDKRYVRKDGGTLHGRVTVSVVRDAVGRPQLAIAMIEDVTEHKRLEEQYLQAQKMEMVGRLAGGVAHDFNNLLTAISGYAGLVKKSLPSGTVARSDIDQVILASERAAQLTRRLLAFSRRQIIEQKVVDLNQLVLEMDKMLRRLIGEDIELVTVPGGDLGAVKVDPGQIEQVLVNLAVNARDAMPHGGKLTIEMANVTLGDEYVRQHVDVSAGEYVLLAVSDTGTGMTDEAKAHIFEPFFTTKDVGKGTGLGLATVYGIVQQHQGHIWVYSEPGQGTAFKYLPRVAAKPEGPAPRDDIAELPRGHETVLVVEDEALVRHLTVKNLTDLGYTVLEAAGGEEALQVFHSHAGTIDLLLTDVIMPQMNGNRLAAQLKALRPDLAVLFTSGYTDETIGHRGVLDEGVAFLQKPFTAAALARKVHEVLRQRKSDPRPPKPPGRAGP